MAADVSEVRSAWDAVSELGCLTGTLGHDDPPLMTEIDAARLILFASFVQQAGEELIRAGERMMSDARSLTTAAAADLRVDATLSRAGQSRG